MAPARVGILLSMCLPAYQKEVLDGLAREFGWGRGAAGERGQAGARSARREATGEREPRAALLPAPSSGEVPEDEGGGPERPWLRRALRDAASVALIPACGAGAWAASNSQCGTGSASCGGGESPRRSRLRLTLMPSEACLTSAPHLPSSRTSPSTSEDTLPGSPLGTAALSVHLNVHGREDGKGGLTSAASSHVQALQMHVETGGSGRGEERRGGGSQEGRNQSHGPHTNLERGSGKGEDGHGQEAEDGGRGRRIANDPPSSDDIDSEQCRAAGAPRGYGDGSTRRGLGKDSQEPLGVRRALRSARHQVGVVVGRGLRAMGRIRSKSGGLTKACGGDDRAGGGGGDEMGAGGGGT